MNRSLAAQDLSQVGAYTWLGLWWGFSWRIIWRLLVFTAIVVVPVFFLAKQLPIDPASFKKIAFYIQYLLGFLLTIPCGARAIDAMTSPTVVFSGYRLSFTHRDGLDDSLHRRSALLRLSWEIAWRFSCFDFLFSFVSQPLKPNAALALLTLFIYIPLWVWIFKGRIGQVTKGYILQLRPGGDCGCYREKSAPAGVEQKSQKPPGDLDEE